MREDKAMHWRAGRRRVASGRAAARRITCPRCHGSDDWPGLMAAARQAMAAVMPASSVCGVKQTGCTMIKSYSKHWACLFPQHGPGRKHQRKIELAQWQEIIVRKYPGEFARGLFHSDGWRGVNRGGHRVARVVKAIGEVKGESRDDHQHED